jgi:branched-subunit amino acid transport protein
MSDWVIIVGMAVVTYATRALPLLSRWKVSHPLAKRALCYAPPAVLAALVTPSLLAPGGLWRSGRSSGPACSAPPSPGAPPTYRLP